MTCTKSFRPGKGCFVLRAPLVLGEAEISDDPAELLFRQVTPRVWVSEEGKPAKDAFGPKSVDKGKPSYSRASKVTAEDAYEWHNLNANSPSVGTWACSLEEVNGANLSAVDDSAAATSSPQAPGHCYVDFRNMTKREERDKRAIMLRAALARGIVYPDAPVLS